MYEYIYPIPLSLNSSHSLFYVSLYYFSVVRMSELLTPTLSLSLSLSLHPTHSSAPPYTLYCMYVCSTTSILQSVSQTTKNQIMK